jgi:hypothetical protein
METSRRPRVKLTFLKKVLKKNEYLSFFTSKRSYTGLLVADANILTSWVEVAPDHYKHISTSTLQGAVLSKEYQEMRFAVDNETVTGSNIYDYHFNAALIINMADAFVRYHYRRARNQKVTGPIKYLISQHQYDEARALLVEHLRPILEMPPKRKYQSSQTVDFEAWCAEMNGAEMNAS